MVQYRVRANSLGEVSTLLDTVVATFDSNLAEANATVSSVAGATWQGDDADKFVELWGQWQDGALMVRAALTGLAAQLRMAESGYISTEVGLSGGFANRRQSTASTAGGAAAMAQRVAANRQGIDEREEAESDPELVSAGYASFVTGGSIAARQSNDKGEAKNGGTAAESTETGEAADV